MASVSAMLYENRIGLTNDLCHALYLRTVRRIVPTFFEGMMRSDGSALAPFAKVRFFILLMVSSVDRKA